MRLVYKDSEKFYNYIELEVLQFEAKLAKELNASITGVIDPKTMVPYTAMLVVYYHELLEPSKHYNAIQDCFNSILKTLKPINPSLISDIFVEKIQIPQKMAVGVVFTVFANAKSRLVL